MDFQTKNMLVDALTKIVDDAPTKSAIQYTSYPQNHIVNKEIFDIWINYIFSVMQIISSYVDVSVCRSDINSIIMQPNPNNEYTAQVNAICHIILNFARRILYL